jgi:hypothetical protein
MIIAMIMVIMTEMIKDVITVMIALINLDSDFTLSTTIPMMTATDAMALNRDHCSDEKTQ